MQHDLLLSQALLRKIAARQQAGQPVTGEIARLKSLAGAIGSNHQLLRECFAARDSVAGGLGPVAAARHTAMQEGYLAFLDEYLGIIKNLPDDTVPPYLLDSLNSRLKSLLPDHPAPLLGALPYRHLRWPGQLPATTPEIVPAYLGGDQTVRPADLAASPEAPLTSEIATLAESLHWSPVEIYGWVKNNIKSEWYWGVMKGAEETLRQGSGNDADQAALLVALLRAAGYPARFVRGTIEFFPDPAGILAQTGVTDTQALAIFFQKAGIPCQPVIRGGRIANLQIEHIWVEAEIPYANYRGVVLDDQGKTWLALDTQIKSAGVTVNTPPALPAGVDLAALRDQYLAEAHPESPLEFLRATLTAAGAEYESLLHQRSSNGELIQILPASLQFVKIAVTGEYPTLPESLHHRVRLAASHDGANLFTGTLPLADLSNRSLAVVYEPATVEDQEIINSYGGLANTPAYLVQLRPVLTVDGQRTLIGTSGLPVGSDFQLTVELLAPNNQSERIENALTIGNLAVLGLVAQQAVVVAEPPAGEKTAEWLLHERALAYIDEWNAAEEELAALLNLPLLRPLPTLVTLGGVVEVTWLLDTPHGIEWRGAYVDGDFRAVELGGAADKQKIFMRLSGLQGSVLEERVLSEGFGVEAVSTAKLLGLSNGEGLVPLLLTKANLAAELPGLDLPANAVADITSAVFQGQQVTIPPAPSLYEDWQGIGYLKENPESGEAGWMLSGQIAGGMTATNPERWPLDAAAEILANPFSEQPNRDPDSALFIQKITATDLQVGTVGQPLPVNPQVYVTDRNHKPVKGAEVTFTVKAGGGKLANRQHTVADQLVLKVKTNGQGVGEVELTTGQHTSDNPGIWWEKDTTYSQQVGENIVDAALKSGASIASPFTALAKPDAPDHLLATMGANGWGYVLNWGGPVGLIVADRYGNSLANQTVIFTALPPENLAACDNPETDLGPARLASGDDPCARAFPSYEGSCGSPSLTTVTDYRGTHAQVILGPMPGALYRITARAGDLATDFAWWTLPEVDCEGTDKPAVRFLLDLQHPVDQYGTAITAGPVGGKVPVAAHCALLREEGTVDGVGTYYIDTTSITEVVMGAPPAPMVAMGNGLYEGEATLGELPGVNEIAVTCRAEVAGEVLSAVKTVKFTGVDLRFPYGGEGVTPAGAVVVAVNEAGYVTRDQAVSYQILPAEYQAGSAFLFVYRDGEPIFLIPTEITGIGFATLARGMWFKPGGDYEVEVVLNPSSGVEIRSDKVPLRVVALELDADLNRDGLFEEDDPQEYTSPGLIVLLNRNDDNDNKHVDLVDLTDDNVDSNGNKVADPDLIKVELNGLPDDLETGSMFLELVGGQKQLRIWDSPDKQHLLLEPWYNSADAPDSNPMAIWPLDGSLNVGKMPKEIYLEGVKESLLSGEVQLRAGYLPPDGGEAVETDRLAITVVNVEMHVDEDRNGSISFYRPSGVDLTGDFKYTFWLNNDFDYMHHEEEGLHEDDKDNAPSGSKNSDDIYIGYLHESDPDNAYNSYAGCKRDLEDFAMLQLRVPVWLKDMDGVKYSLKFKDGVTGDPAINLFEAQHKSTMYLDNETIANKQILKTKLNTKPISNGDDFEIPRELVDKNGLVAPFIFEGVTEGSGQLELTVKINGVVLAQTIVALNLKDITWFYDRFALQGVSGTSWRAQVGNAATPLSQAAYTSISPSSDYLLLVHGWNMLPHEKYRWTETVFKRLWWQGYTGRVGSFEWPSLEFSPMPDVITDPTNFSDGEFIAWQSAEALSNLLTELGGTYQLSVLAHSQGNVVMGEALKKYSGPQLKAYIASQAAITANLYDNGRNFASPSWFLALENHIPNVYGHFSSGLNPDLPYFSGNPAKVVNRFNYFNSIDYALTGIRWELNNAMKPFHDFDYIDKDGNRDQFNQAGGDMFFRTDMITDSDGGATYNEVPLDINTDRDRYSIFSYIAESKVMALGTQVVNSGVLVNRNLKDWKFDHERYSHSRQFRSNIVREYPYWAQLISDCKLVTIKQEKSR